MSKYKQLYKNKDMFFEYNLEIFYLNIMSKSI